MSPPDTVEATAVEAGDRILNALVGHTHNDLRKLARQSAQALLPATAAPHDEQVNCIAALLEGRDVFAQMHTGFGKSLTFQAAAHIERGRTGAGCGLVISPITALSDDHAANARGLGLRAHAYHTRMDPQEKMDGVRAWQNGESDLFMVGPEALAQPTSTMIRALQERPPAFVAIDESHLVHMWGLGFRPDYRNIRHNLERHLADGAAQVPWIALSATVTDRIERDVVQNLKLTNMYRYKGSILRENLRLRLAAVSGADVAEYPKVLLPLIDHSEGPQIIYAQYARDAERLSRSLRNQWKRSVTRYHAKERPNESSPMRWQQETAEEFRSGKAECMIATNAYGMGIDLPFEIRSVTCLGPPQSLAELVQQLGRAGRRGSESLCTLLHSPELLKKQRKLTEMSWPDPSVLHNVLIRKAEQEGDMWKVFLPGVPRDEDGRPRVNDVGNVLPAGSKDPGMNSAIGHLWGMGLLELLPGNYSPNHRYSGKDFRVADGAFDRAERALELDYRTQRQAAIADAEAVRGFIDRVSRGACAQEELLAAFNDPQQGHACADLTVLPCSSCDENHTLAEATCAATEDFGRAAEWMAPLAA